MKRGGFLILCCMVFCPFLVGIAWSASICVDPGGGGDYTNLQTALTAVSSNGSDNTIKIVQATYTGNFTYSSTGGKNITLLGGYTTGTSCADANRVVYSPNTILDGSASGTVLFFNNSQGGNITVDGLTIRNGKYSDFSGLYAFSTKSSGTAGTITITNNSITGNTGGGLGASSSSDTGTAGDVILENNIITGNSGTNGGGVHAGSFSTSGTVGNIIFTNNVIAGNSATNGAGIHISSYTYGGAVAGTVTLTNNTITGNSSTTNGGGVYVYAYYNSGGIVNFYNNIIWKNTAGNNGEDIYLSLTGGTANGYNNDYDDMSGD